jgi:hypothetical protein
MYSDFLHRETVVLCSRVWHLQAEAAEEQTSTVRKLRQAVEQGEAGEEELVKAEGLLANLSASLQYLQSEMNVTVRNADTAFKRGLLGTSVVRSSLLITTALMHLMHLRGACARMRQTPEISLRCAGGLKL